MKKCSVCKMELDENMFSKDIQKKDGLRTSCRKCESDRNKLRYEKRTGHTRKLYLEPNVGGFNNYHITKDGRVINRVTGKERKLQKNKNGYLYCDLWDNKMCKVMRVNRLVALAYIENPENKTQVNHIDGNKENNNVNNLEWVTAKENTIHAYRTGLASNPKGEDSPNYGKLNNGSSKPVVAIDGNGNEFEFKSAREAIRQGYGSSPSKISSCINGKRKSHGGYRWKRKI